MKYTIQHTPTRSLSVADRLVTAWVAFIEEFPDLKDEELIEAMQSSFAWLLTNPPKTGGVSTYTHGPYVITLNHFAP